MVDSNHTWPADRVERRPIASLIPAARNARTHSPEQVAQLCASMLEWGWTVPVLVDEGGVLIAGHGRVMAAQALEWPEVPVMVATGWTEAQKRAYLIADNKLAMNAGWDFAALQAELEALDVGAFDASLTGFTVAELEQVATWTQDGLKQGHTDPDMAPAAPIVPVSRLGDLWLLGRHRLLCGDATSAGAVDNLLAGAKPGLMVTDPPYGVDYDADWRNHALRSNGSPSNGRAIGKSLNDDRADWREAWMLFPGDVVYCWHAPQHANRVQDSLEAAGLIIRSQIIWAKHHFAIGRGNYHVKHEPCLYAVRKGGTGHWAGDHTQTTLWEIDKPMKNETGHSAQKPVECMLRPILNNSARGDGVYDPFVGSGTTIIAAEQTGRRCFGMDISPAYVDVGVQRWQEFTREEATLDGDGRTFEEVKHARSQAHTDTAEAGERHAAQASD